MTTPSPCGRVGEGSGVWFGLLVSSHTGLRPKRGGYGREDGDEDVEDFSPGAVVVESSHSVRCLFSRLDIRLIIKTLPCGAFTLSPSLPGRTRPLED